MSRRAPAATVAVLLASLATTGCLVHIPNVDLVTPTARHAQLPDTLGVMPFEDMRPREQHRGKTPWLIPLIIWNQRIGRYVTSSEHFGGDVSGSVTRAVADALSGWRYGRARMLEHDPDATPDGHCRRDELGYVASGEIHHLYGAVRQRAWFFLLINPWMLGVLSGNDVGDPVGVARVTLRLHDCGSGETVLERRFVSEGLYPRLSPSVAAQRAFDDLIDDVTALASNRRPAREGGVDVAAPPLPTPAGAPLPGTEPGPSPPEDDAPAGLDDLVPL